MYGGQASPTRSTECPLAQLGQRRRSAGVNGFQPYHPRIMHVGELLDHAAPRPTRTPSATPSTLRK